MRTYELQKEGTSATKICSLHKKWPSLPFPAFSTGPFQISELVPIHWPHLVSQLSPSFSPAPLSLPTPRCCGDHGNIMPRRPTVPLAVQLSEILLEPATNPVPPKRSKTTKKAWKRPKSTKLGFYRRLLFFGGRRCFLFVFLGLVLFVVVVVVAVVAVVAVVSMTVRVKIWDTSRWFKTNTNSKR